MKQKVRREHLCCNLKDAGLNETEIQAFLKLKGKESSLKQRRLLEQQRIRLLEQLHLCQRQIDCLDFLCFTLKEQLQEENNNEHDISS